MTQIKYLIKRGGVYWYCRRVPKHLQSIDTRKTIRETLRTDDLSKALPRLKEINRKTEEYFETLAHSGMSNKEHDRFEQAVRRAKYFGVVYKEVGDIVDGPLDDLQKRLEIAEKHIENPAAVEAVLGGAPSPKLSISNVPDLYFNIAKGAVKDKTEQQLRHWKQVRMKCVHNFISVVGDILITDLTKNEALAFRDYWLDRLKNEGRAPNTANQEFGHLQQMFKTVADHYRVPFIPLFSGLRFSEKIEKPRLPFTTEFILERLLAPDALKGISEACRALIHLMADCGARPAELIGVNDQDVYLDHPVPYVHIRPNEYRQLKTKNSERELPLIGYALKAANDGAFEKMKRYRVNTINLSNLVGVYFKRHKVIPSDQHTLYSLRHSFEDRMTAIDVPERIKTQLMGHKYHRPSYGLGGDLSLRQKWMKKFAL